MSEIRWVGRSGALRVIRGSGPWWLALALALWPQACRKGADGVALPSVESAAGDATAGEAASAPTDDAATQAAPEPTARSFTGMTEANRRSVITSRIGGIIDAVHVQEGQAVHAGDKLVTLDTADLKLMVRQANAALAAARVQVKTTNMEAERFASLGKDGAVPQQQVDLTQAQADGAAAGVQMAKVALDRAKKALADAVIVAPYDGVITARRINEGEFAAAMPPTPLVIIEEQDPMLVRLQVPAAVLGEVERGTRMDVRIPALGLSVRARVTRTVPTMNPTTQTAAALVELPNRDRALKPGLFAEASVSAGSDVTAAPREEAAP